MDSQIYHGDFLHLCGVDLGRISVRKDGIYLKPLSEDLLSHFSDQEKDMLSFKAAREAFVHTDWEDPILEFPITMEEFNKFVSLAGAAKCVDQQRLKDFLTDQQELNSSLERHAQAMTGDSLEDRIYRGMLIQTVEDRNLDEVINDVSEIVNELDEENKKTHDDVQASKVALCSDALCLLKRLRSVRSSKDDSYLGNEMTHLEDAAVRLVYRIFERETKGIPYERAKKFLKGRRVGALSALGKKVMDILREHIEAQQGDKRKFPTWGQVVRKLKKDPPLSGNGKSLIYDVVEEYGNEGTIEMADGKNISFGSLRARLTDYRKSLKKEYRIKKIDIT